MPRHAAGDRDGSRSFTSTPCSSSRSASCAHVVLRLRDREPVAGDDDDLLRVPEHDRDVLGRRRADGAFVGRAAAPRPPCTWPNAPKRTFAIERFIARPIISVSSVPDAPTSAPLTIRTLFSSSKPVAAAASPVNAFSSEITTGMSAPPIGSTKRTPKSERAGDQHHEQPLLLGAGDDRDAGRDERGEQHARCTTFWPG